MKKTLFVSLALAGWILNAHATDGYADSVVSYNPGTGYDPGYTNAAAALGEPARVTPGAYGGPVDPFDPPYLPSQLVSIGEGGSLTVKFKTPILNHPHNPFGVDFIIFGNSFFVVTNDFDFTTFQWVGTPATDGSMFGANPGANRVSVSRDGKTFYVLNPALAPVVDGLFPTDGSGNFHKPVNPIFTQDDFSGLTLDDIRFFYNGSGGGTSYDISWAQDANGKPVKLTEINYIRVKALSGKTEVAGFSAVFVPPGSQKIKPGLH